jgi:serine/threonine-protein kinase
MAISPDGSRLVYLAGDASQRQLFVRPLNQPDPESIPGTEGAGRPFFSPDSRWVGFFADGMLKKVDLEGGGAVVDLCDAPQPRGGSWGPDDVIFFTPHGWRGLWKIPASGGTAEMVTDPDNSNGEQHRHPEVLPSGKAVLYTVWTGSFHDSSIAVLSLETGERKDLIEWGTYAHYAPTGHLVFARAGTLLAAPFDAEKLEVTGIPIPVFDEVRYSGVGHAAFTFSTNGSLVYGPGGSRSLVWVDRQGASEPLTSFRWGRRQLLQLSPDGQRVITTIGEDIWVYEIERGTLTRLTMDPGQDWAPIWSPDGQEVAFSSRRSGEYRLYRKAADGSGVAEEMLAIEYFDFPTSWSPDGKALAFAKNHPTQGYDIWILPLEGEQEPWPFAETVFHELYATFSPDGKWLASVSNESGRREVYVQPFPGPGGKVAISADGGDYPIWAPNGKELFYQEGNKLMAVAIETDLSLTAGIPRPLFEVRNFETLSWAYDISPDGERFMVFEDREPELRIVLNWFEELERLVPIN